MPSLVQTFIETLVSGKPDKGAAYGPPQQQEKGAAEAEAAAAASSLDILDIRRDTVEASLKEEIHNLFHPEQGPRKLPTLLLYDEKGLQLFEKVWTCFHALPHVACRITHS